MLKTSIFAWKNHYCVSSLLFLFFNPVTIATSVNFYLTYILNTDVNVWVRFNINFNDIQKIFRFQWLYSLDFDLLTNVFLQFENLHMFILLNDGHCIISIKNTTPYIYRLQNYLFKIMASPRLIWPGCYI